MAWLIKCSDSKCLKKETWAANIVDLINDHRDENGWFVCSCGRKGYVEKSFPLQERGEVWEPFLKGIITLGDEGDTYQPFVFKVSSKRNTYPDALWFSYYKDLRAHGGTLKLGYGPGGPPVLHKDTVLLLIKQLIKLDIIDKVKIKELLIKSTLPVEQRLKIAKFIMPKVIYVLKKVTTRETTSSFRSPPYE